MPNWSVKATDAAISANNPANMDITFTATNSSTSEVVTEVVASSNWSVNKAKAHAEIMVDRLNLRDAAKAVSSSSLPALKAFIATNTVLSAG